MKNKVLYILKKIKKSCVIAVLMAFCFMGLSGCKGIYYSLRDLTNDGFPETGSSIESGDADKTEDAWGLSDIMGLFNMWEWQPSGNPTCLAEIADRAGRSQESMAGQIGNAEKALLRLPEMKAENPEIAFHTEESKKQFLGIEWNDYVFQKAETVTFHSDSQGLWGHAYLCNGLQKQMEDKPAVFVSYYFWFETQRLEIMEIVEATEEVTDYACILDYESNVQKVSLHTEEGIRLLNPAAELNPHETVLPVSGLNGKELERYIAFVFLDIVRNPHDLNKYEKVFPEESISLLKQLNCYYEKPEEIYDFVRFRGIGDVTVTSQFQPTLWGNILIDIHIWFEYDTETGKIDVKDGQFILAEKP